MFERAYQLAEQMIAELERLAAKLERVNDLLERLLKERI